MFTSYFWRFHLKEVPHLVSIAWKTPEWFQGRRYPAGPGPQRQNAQDARR